MMFPLSFTLKFLLSWLSTKSPSGAKVASKTPTIIQLPSKYPKLDYIKQHNTNVRITPPMKPSQVFLGEIVGAILCFPNNLPEQ